MPFTDILPQSQFFYNLKWNAEMDTLLLRRIIVREAECYPTPPYKSPHTLLCTMGSINEEFGTWLRLVDVEERVAFLEGRYKTFKRITRLPETHWDLQRNIITANDGVWQRILKEYVFAQAYYHNGEPEYYKMCVLFGSNGIKIEPSRNRTLIILTDSPTAKLESKKNSSEYADSEDEVTFPPVRAPARLARKLFDDDAHSQIAPPKRSSGHYYSKWPAIEGKLKFPGKNAFTPKPKDSVGQPSGVGDSFCASSSPLK